MTRKMTKAIVYIDGENFLHRIADTLKNMRFIQKKEEIIYLEVRQLLEELFPEYQELDIRYYGTKIRTYDINDKNILEHAKRLVESQRRLKRYLESQDIEFIIAGSLRVKEASCMKCRQTSLVFKEKGVDVRCAVDIVEEAGRGIHQVILSSDSDMLPALRVARAKKSHLTYVHHAEQPNYAMLKAANESRVFTPAQIIKIFKKEKKK